MAEDEAYAPHIDASLEGGLDTFETEVKRRYADKEDGKAMWAFADRVAELIQRDALDLTGEHDSQWPAIRDALVQKDLGQDLEYALQARLAWHLLPSFELAGKRCWELAALLRRANPPEQVRRFLSRVTRCYLLDFVPECLVMCRAALENAVYARFATAGVALPRTTDGRQTMRHCLEEAERRGWLNGVAADRLHAEVWQRGSKAAHSDPTVVGDAIGAIELTTQALAGLSPA